MKGVHRMTVATVAVAVLAASVARPLLAQERSPVDLTGTWRWVHHEDQ